MTGRELERQIHEFWLIVFASWTVEEICALDRDAWAYSVKV